jgi:hypothetical protein
MLKLSYFKLALRILICMKILENYNADAQIKRK